MKIKNWIACVQDRGKWKEVVEKAKTFNQEVQRMEEEELRDNRHDFTPDIITVLMTPTHNKFRPVIGHINAEERDRNMLVE